MLTVAKGKKKIFHDLIGYIFISMSHRILPYMVKKETISFSVQWTKIIPFDCHYVGVNWTKNLKTAE